MSPRFLEDLAQARPDPGGGAAAAYGAKVGLALLEKVVQLELKRPHLENPHGASWDQTLTQLRQLRADFSRLQEQDVQAYMGLARCRGTGKPGSKLPVAVQEALEVPRQIMAQAHEALMLVAWAGTRGKKHLLADLLVAAEFLAAALQGAYHIACANLSLITEVEDREALASTLAQTSHQGRQSFLQVKQELAARELHLDPRG